jgi:hypothetical protein
VSQRTHLITQYTYPCVHVTEKKTIKVTRIKSIDKSIHILYIHVGLVISVGRLVFALGSAAKKF